VTDASDIMPAGDFKLAFLSSSRLLLDLLVGLILLALTAAAVAFPTIDAAPLGSLFICVESATTTCIGGSLLTTLIIELRRADCCLSAMFSAESGFFKYSLESTSPSLHVVLS
jgi:hypothetical protein